MVSDPTRCQELRKNASIEADKFSWSITSNKTLDLLSAL